MSGVGHAGVGPGAVLSVGRPSAPSLPPCRRALYAREWPQKALCGGIPGDGFGIWGRFWSHFVGNCCPKLTNLSRIDFEIPPRRTLSGVVVRAPNLGVGPAALHRTSFTLHPSSNTLHPTPYPLHPTPYTHQPTP